MPLTDAGALAIAKLLHGTAQTIFDFTNGRLGVGDSTTVFAKTQTDLQAATNKLRKQCDAPYPTLTGATITYRATFAPADAVWTWNEWGVFNAGPTGGVMINRKVENLLAKPSSQSWQFTVDLLVQA